MKPEFKLNPQTGNHDANIQATLKSVGTTILRNSNGKNYKVISVEFKNSKGEKQLASAAIYEGNYSKGIAVGKTYLTRVSITPDKQVYLQMSHLENAARATASDFGWVDTTVKATEDFSVKA